MLVILRKETNLIPTFGKQYEDYRHRTGARLPRARP